ncbi:UDP-glucose/GDP-mannose dehydrogenase family protein [Myxococcota bacterium]|nr:UDP-glucose/GDP-mannose dehydrogenase family protein [Myxococcota bacterium]
MNICVVGTGYVGLVTGACFSEFGVRVTCADKLVEKIESLDRCEMPIYEPGLEDLVRRNLTSGRLDFTTETTEAIRQALVVFIAVGTPAAQDGSTDLSYVESVAREIGQAMEGFTVVVTKSTVPVGTGKKVRQWIQEELDASGREIDFSVVSNPEFLREGAAIGDFMRPDRVVIGLEDQSPQSLAIMKDLYRPLFLNETPFVITNLATAELSKYAANAFLATKISFVNELSILCDQIGGDVQATARAMGLDRRIGKKFLHAGPGFGGSCFPKDTLSAAHFAREMGNPFEIVEAVLRVNERQRGYAYSKIVDACGGDVSGRTVALLGLAFKPETDDVRDAPSLHLITNLLEQGARVRAYDPEAMQEISQLFSGVELCQDAYEACKGSDVLAIVTEWNEFRMLDLPRVRQVLKSPKMVDMRNIYEPESIRAAGFEYWGIGNG